MNCPKCNSEKIIHLHEDPIPCTDCDSVIVVDHFMCPACNYSFRTTNGKFLDGANPMEMGDAVKDLLETLDRACGNFEDECGSCSGCHSDSMIDSVHNCVKCGQALVLSPDLTEYHCPYCGFEWEILESE